MKEISFTVSKRETQVIREIALRAVAGFGDCIPKDHGLIGVEMDITACHANGCKLRLFDLAASDNFNFAHDVFGIMRHLDRENGLLRNCFRPRFAA